MRVNERESPLRFYVLSKHSFEKGCLPNACLSDDVHVAETISLFDAELPMWMTTVSRAEVCDLIIRLHEYECTGPTASAGGGRTCWDLRVGSGTSCVLSPKLVERKSGVSHPIVRWIV